MEDRGQVPDLEAHGLVDNRYALLAELGRGSTGVVWEAEDRVASRMVAIKMLPTRLLASSATRRRFRREAEIAGTLRHPHSVEVLAHGETSDGAYLVMERLIGVTLADRLRQSGPLPQLRAIEIAAQILDAVAAAHRVNVVHRDLKPANVILIDRDGDPDFVKVCDFGLAKALEPDRLEGEPEGEKVGADDASGASDSVSTERGHICGTPEYMAPEQARGDVIDGRADLYSVAAILYHAVLGQVPFRGRSPLAVVTMHLHDAPPRPSMVRPDLEIFPPLEALILRGLAKDRAQRPSSAEVFRADLLQIKRDYSRRGVSGPRPTDVAASAAAATLPGATPGSSPRRNTRAITLGGVAALAVVAMLVVASKRPSGPEHPLLPPPGPAPTHQAGRDQTEQQRPDPRIQPGPVLPEAESPAAEVGTSAQGRRGRKRRAVADTTTVADADGEELVRPAEERLRRGQIAEACATGQIAATSAPRSPAVWEFLGRCYMRLALPQEARAYYRKALALAPDGPKAAFIRAMLGQEKP